MKIRTSILMITLGGLLCTTGCTSKNNAEITTGYIYNLSDLSSRTFSEPYDIVNVSWSPDSNYFMYTNWDSKVKGNATIRQAHDLKVIENPLDNKKYYKFSVLYNWNKKSDLIVTIENKGDFCFKPGTLVLEKASEADKETESNSQLSEEEIKSLKEKFGIPNKEMLSSNETQTKFYYSTSKNQYEIYDIKKGEKEHTVESMVRPIWSPSGNKIIYSIPKAGFGSIQKKSTYKSDQFETYIYDFNSKKKTKIADFYAECMCFSPDEKFLILVPHDYNNHFEI